MTLRNDKYYKKEPNVMKKTYIFVQSHDFKEEKWFSEE